MVDREKWAIIKTLQKGKHVTSYIHKPLEDLIVYILYDTDVSADTVSFAAYILAIFTAYLFYNGYFLYAFIFSFLVGVLDGVDGKIARLRKKPTKLGKLEHVFDTLYEYLWYIVIILSFYRFGLLKQEMIMILGLLWIALDGLNKQTYNIFWIMTGKPLRTVSGIANIVTRIDSRRSMYMIHLFIWWLVNKISFALFTITIHQLLTLISYIVLTIKHKD